MGCFMPCLIRPEFLALEYCGCLKKVQDECVLAHGRKVHQELLDIGKSLMTYRKFPFSLMKFGRIFCYILFPRTFLSGTLAGSSSPGHSLWSQKESRKIRKKSGNNQGNSILLQGFFTGSHGRSLYQTNFEVLCDNFH